MKISITVGGYYDIFGQIEFTKNCGFDACDFPLQGYFSENGTFGDIDNVTDEMIEEFFTPIREKAESVGLEIGQTHSVGGGRLTGTTMETMVKREIGCIKAAKVLGAKYIAMHPIMHRERIYDKYKAEEFAINFDYFSRMIPTLKECGVYGCLENMFAYDRVYGFYCPTIFSTAEELVEMCDALGENFRICLDVGHSVLGWEDPVHMAHVCGDRIAILHTHDNDGFGDCHTFPFTKYESHTGDVLRVDWYKFMQALDDINYKGNLNFESGAPGPREINRIGYEYFAEVARYLASLRKNG